MPADERTYRRNSRSTQTESIIRGTSISSPPKRNSLFSSVINFVTTATTTASLEFDRLCESIGIVNKENESETDCDEDVTDESDVDDHLEYGHGRCEESEVNDLEIKTFSAVSRPRYELKSPAVAKTTQTAISPAPAYAHAHAALEVRKWSPPRTNKVVVKEESSSEEDQWKPPDVMAQVRRINEKLKQNGAYGLQKKQMVSDIAQSVDPFTKEHSSSRTESESEAHTIKLESAIKTVQRHTLSSKPLQHVPNNVLSGIIKSEPVELTIKDHASPTNEAPEQAARRVTFASPDKSERDRFTDTPSSQLHLYNLQLERERVERLEKELASVKAKVETLTAISPKAEKEETRNHHSVTHEKPPEEALPSPSTSPSRMHSNNDDQKKRYWPIMARPTPLTQVSPNPSIYSQIKLKSTNIAEGEDVGLRPNEEMKKVLLEIPEVKLRQAKLIKQPDGTFIVNKFWNEIYNHENASPSLNQAQATPVATTAGFIHSQLISDQSSNLASTAEQPDSSIANSKRKYSSYHNDISSQYDHSHTKASKLSE